MALLRHIYFAVCMPLADGWYETSFVQKLNIWIKTRIFSRSCVIQFHSPGEDNEQNDPELEWSGNADNNGASVQCVLLCCRSFEKKKNRFFPFVRRWAIQFGLVTDGYTEQRRIDLGSISLRKQKKNGNRAGYCSEDCVTCEPEKRAIDVEKERTREFYVTLQQKKTSVQIMRNILNNNCERKSVKNSS